MNIINERCPKTPIFFTIKTKLNLIPVQSDVTNHDHIKLEHPACFL